MEILSSVAEELQFKLTQIEDTVKLFDEGATVPFIARYRKEVTGNLDEEQIRDVIEKVTYYRNLEKRKEEVLRLIEEQGKLTDELKKSIESAKKLQEVEDLYLPYKKKKKNESGCGEGARIGAFIDICVIAKNNNGSTSGRG